MKSSRIPRNRIEKVSNEEFKLLCLFRNRQRRRVSRFEVVINNHTGKIRCREIVRVDNDKKLV